MADINFPSSPSGGDTYTYNNITFTYDGEKWTAKAPVTTSNTYDDANVAAYASAQGFIDLADISVSSNSPSGNGSLSYNNGSGVFTFTPADAVSSSSETTFTADVNFDTGVSEKFSTLTGATGVVTHDCDNGHIFYHTSISADFTANFTNLGLSTNYGTTLTLVLAQGATAYIPSAVQIGGSGQTINWQGGSAPTGTVNGIDAVSFTVLEVSGTYVVLGQLVDFT
jgi:hypothetical protein